MTVRVIKHLVLPSALSVAILAAAGCSGSQHNNPATQTSTGPMPAPPAPVTSSRSPLHTSAFNTSTATVAHRMTVMAPAAVSSISTAAMADFPARAATEGMLEIRLAELALSKSDNANVKVFARRMKDDHTAIDANLRDIVGSGKLPASLTPGQQQLVASLKSRSGKGFDKAYLDAAIKNHRQAISLYESASHDARTSQLREFASRMLPKFDHHLDMAKRLQSKLGG